MAKKLQDPTAYDQGLAQGAGEGEDTGTPIPQMGQKTRPQSRTQASFEGITTAGVVGLNPSQVPGRASLQTLVSRIVGGTPGMPSAPYGDYAVYRAISHDPTVAIAQAVVHGPIQASAWSIRKRADDVPDEWRDFVAFIYEPQMTFLKTRLLEGLSFGNRSFEQVYRQVEWNGSIRIGVKRFKPLRPEFTQILIDQNTGSYAGLRNAGVDLEPEETLHYGYQVEDDNWYGVSRHENIREDAWWPWRVTLQNLFRMQRKISNIVPIIKGPVSAVETDKSGQETKGIDAANVLLDALVNGDGVVMENLVSGVDDIMNTPELAKATRWVIEPFDTGVSAQSVDGILNVLRYFDQLKLRGWLRPERTATEGQHGTKAEVEDQADVGLAEGEQINVEMAQLVNSHSVNRLLEWNFGPEAIDQVYIEPAPLIDEKKAVYRWVMTALIANPSVLDLLLSYLDIDGMADQLEIPRTGSLNITPQDDATIEKQIAAGGGAAKSGALLSSGVETKRNPLGLTLSRIINKNRRRRRVMERKVI